MADTVRTQGTVMEVPVTIQGSKTVEGAEQRELFTESTKTTLVFENGAVLKLNAKISPGQCVFLRNDETEREILCRVRDSKQAGEAGYTDLEFTVYDPQFWGAEKLAPTGSTPTAQDIEAAVKSPIAAPNMESIAPIGGEIPVHMEQPAASAKKAEMQKEIKEALESPVGAPILESSAPSEEIPATSAKTPATTFASPLPLKLEAPHESLSSAKATETKEADLDWNEAKDAELLALLAAMDGKPNTPRKSDTKEKRDANENGAEAALEDVKKQSEKSPDAANEAAVTSMPVPRINGLSKFTAGKNSVAIGIAAAVLLAAALGFAWHEKNEFSIRARNRQLAASVQANQTAIPVTPQASQAPASSVSPGINDPGAAPTQATQNIPQPSETQAPSVAVAKSPDATTARAGAARESKGVEDSTGTAAPKGAASKSSFSSDREQLGQARHQKASETDAGKTIPARIVSQEPPSIPAWATGLETDEVVKLDALIDEKGNLVETKPISGPRILQHEAQRAVALWVFEPALTDGKPTATRMVLTVQFK